MGVLRRVVEAAQPWGSEGWYMMPLVAFCVVLLLPFAFAAYLFFDWVVRAAAHG